MAIAYLNHTPIGKATQAQAYTAAAHLRYITRKNATDYVYSERMPVQYHAAQRFMIEREDRIRKNGRVCDKFIIALPREMTMMQGVDALRDFGHRLSDGRAPFLFSIQDFNSENPHAHFCYVDESVVDGSRVFKTTDRDSTDRIKTVWAETCNEHLLELGRTEQIEFGRAEEVANDNAVEHTAHESPVYEPHEHIEPVEPAAPECTSIHTDVEPEADLPLPEEEEEFEVSEPYVDYSAKERHEKIKAAVSARRDRDYLKGERDELARLEEAVKAAIRAAEDRHTDFNIASMDASLAAMTADVAQERLDVTPRGFRIKLPSLNLGIWQTPEVDWKSPGMKQRAAAKAVKDAAVYRALMAYTKADEANTAAAHAARQALEIEKKREALEKHLATRGTTEELIEAEKILEQTSAHYIAGMTSRKVINELEEGRITVDEAREAHTIMGHEAEWQVYADENDLNQDEGIEQ